jgi:hypothetical protein
MASALSLGFCESKVEEEPVKVLRSENIARSAASSGWLSKLGTDLISGT